MPATPFNTQIPNRQERSVKLYNNQYPKGTILHVSGATYVMPEKGLQFGVLERHARHLLALHRPGGVSTQPLRDVKPEPVMSAEAIANEVHDVKEESGSEEAKEEPASTESSAKDSESEESKSDDESADEASKETKSTSSSRSSRGRKRQTKS